MFVRLLWTIFRLKIIFKNHSRPPRSIGNDLRNRLRTLRNSQNHFKNTKVQKVRIKVTNYPVGTSEATRLANLLSKGPDGEARELRSPVGGEPGPLDPVIAYETLI